MKLMGNTMNSTWEIFPVMMECAGAWMLTGTKRRQTDVYIVGGAPLERQEYTENNEGIRYHYGRNWHITWWRVSGDNVAWRVGIKYEGAKGQDFIQTRQKKLLNTSSSSLPHLPSLSRIYDPGVSLGHFPRSERKGTFVVCCYWVTASRFKWSCRLLICFARTLVSSAKKR